ncbi:hypothetical protein JKF63_02456 [Porcisia hertigi]|uniref:CLASP N-terminal domain-containing protein n=1 Tax=Porcisia hertigi TaxID=2761500 RepID=A0A836I417_9TRYP|nr:hypothetical protein JKF63_02456 [Porcisia hertigi]
MAHPGNVALSDEAVLRRVQLLGDAITREQQQTKDAIGLRQSLRDQRIQLGLLEEVARLLVDDVPGRPAFVGWMSLYMKKCLLQSMESRRTPVVLAAINVVKTLAENGASRSAVAVICSWFLPCMVRLAGSPSVASAVSAAAMQAVLSVAQKCMFTLESVSQLVCGCGGASSAVRRCSLEVLRSYLQAAKGTTAQMPVTSYNAALHRVLRDRMRDADAEVRHAARRCFWSLHVLDQASTEALFRTLPVGVQRQLAAERTESMQELNVIESSSGHSTLAPPAPIRGNCVVPNSHTPDTACGSRTVTMKDDLQSAVAIRARTLNALAMFSGKTRRQLLRSSRETGHHPEAGAITPIPYSYARRGGASAVGAASAHFYAAPHRPNGHPSFFSSLESTDWSIRHAAVLEGQRLCETGSLIGVDLAAFLAGLITRLQDIHFRVVEGAQRCLRVLMARAPSATEKELHTLLSPLVSALVRNTSHARPSVSAGARHLLDCIVRTHEPPQEVLMAVLHTADNVAGSCLSMAQRCAEVLHYFIVVRSTLFVEVSIMSMTVQGILAHVRVLEGLLRKGNCSSGPRAAQGSWFHALGAVFLVCPESFRKVVSRLDPSRQEEARAALRESFGLADADREGSLPDASAVCERWSRCQFAEELKVHTTSNRSVKGSDELLSAAGGQITEDGGVSEVSSLTFGALRHASQQLCEFLSVPETCPPSCKAIATHSEDAVAAVSPPLPIVTPHVAQPAAATFTPSHAPVCAEEGDRYSVADTTVQRLSLQGAVRDKDPVANYLRERPHLRSIEERRRALLSLAEALRYGGATSEKVIFTHRLSCVQEEVERLIVHWERDLSGMEGEMNHRVRCAVLAALQVLVQWPAARSSLARQLTRVLGICRAGLDDPFLGVQLQAASCLDTLLIASKLPADLCLSAITNCVTKWLDGPTSNEGSPGWVKLLHMIPRVVEQVQPTPAAVKGTNRLAPGVSPVEAGCEREFILTTPILQRVVTALSRCLGHCHVAVRFCAVLVVVAIRRTLGDVVALPLLAPLSAAEMRLVDAYMGKVAVEHPWRLMV